MKRLYVVVRSDIPPGAQLAQAVQAGVAFALHHPEQTRGWHFDSNNLVVLSARDEGHLSELAKLAPAAKTEFREPDFGDQLTAVAFDDAARRMLSQLPLAMRA
jgi:hypothetical protein